MANRRATRFLANLDDAQQQAYSDVAALETALARLLGDARTAWPTISLTDEVFLAHLAARAPTPQEPSRPLADVRGEELYLACGCALGHRTALAAFETTYGTDLAAVARRFRAADPEDVLQRIREKLLVGDGSRPPKIADYAGLGFLQNWVRISAVRSFLDEARRKGPKRELADSDRLMELADPDDDIELAYLKRHYRVEFREAFAQAVDGLTSQQRNALRQHLIAGLTIDQIAAVYGVHRATAARRIADARAALLSGTRRAMAGRLRIGGEELDSVMRLIHSQLDVSVVRLLGSRATVVGLGT